MNCPSSSRRQLSLICAYLAFISLWNSGLSLDFGLSLKGEKLNATAHNATKSLSTSNATESAITHNATAPGISAYARNLGAISNATESANPKPEVRFEKKPETNGTSSPGEKDDTTFQPDTVLFRAEDVVTEKPISIDEVKGRTDLKTTETEVKVEIPPSERMNPLPAHNLTKNPESKDPVSRKLVDREDVQLPVNKTAV
ncbi:uncharacterized protein LOC107041362 isoform X2 [Diachasma alloeum]|uniref:uncharacterized protein LOC107041362 isoform X2 n=1 Tax=Diachasma alloeum TaxID=454923 RepID=UPI000738387B|nr:uncharacterized protein LOC107041362 isoform X2 [Diachasma alloeum]